MPEGNGNYGEGGLKHQLSAGQMAMVTVGGSIGTGLLLGSSPALKIAGPGVILSYVLAGFINWTVTMALGELSSMHPAAGSFGLYADLYLSRYLGFLSRAGYWAAVTFSVGAELVASAAYMAYWFPKVPGLVWVLVFSVLLLAVNFRAVGSYGRFEFWFCMIKLGTIAAFIVIGAGLLFSGRVPQQYTSNGGFLPNGPISPLVAMFFAIYAFGGVEMLAVTTGETKSREEVPRAVRLTFLLLTCIYLGAITVLVGVMPWNHPAGTGSPFVSVFQYAHIPAAASIMNFVVLSAALSGAAAKFYVASRLLFSLGRTGWAPAFVSKLNAAGAPQMALIISSYGVVVALVMEKFAPENAFVYIMAAAFAGLILAWVVALAAHISFRWRLSEEQVRSLPMRSPTGMWGSMVGFVLVAIAVIYTWKTSPGSFTSGAVFLVALSIVYFAMKKPAVKV